MVATSLTRPAHASLLPGLAREPAELTAANVASGWTKSIGTLVGPAISGLVLEQLGPGAVFLMSATIMALAGVLVAGVRPLPTGPLPQPQPHLHRRWTSARSSPVSRPWPGCPGRGWSCSISGPRPGCGVRSTSSMSRSQST